MGQIYGYETYDIKLMFGCVPLNVYILYFCLGRFALCLCIGHY